MVVDLFITMAHCTNCNKDQARLNQGNLCKDCFEQTEDFDNGPQDAFGSQNVQNSFSTMFNPTHMAPIGAGRTPLNDSMNQNYSGLMNLSQNSRFAAPPSMQQFTGNNQNHSQDFDVNTPVSALTAGQMLALIQSQTKPLEAKVVGIDQKLDREINGLQTRINVLENEMKEQKVKNEALTQIVVEMQKCLNKVDNVDREKNMIVSGLPETELKVDDISLKEDKEKIEKLFSLIDVRGGPWNVERLGKPTTNGKSRLAKVTFPDKVSRDEAVDKSKTIKDLGEPWKKVYLNRDKHAVYRCENNRLRKKMNEYRKKQNFRITPKSVSE